MCDGHNHLGGDCLGQQRGTGKYSDQKKLKQLQPIRSFGLELGLGEKHRHHSHPKKNDLDIALYIAAIFVIKRSVEEMGLMAL